MMDNQGRNSTTPVPPISPLAGKPEPKSDHFPLLYALCMVIALICGSVVSMFGGNP